MSLKLGTQDIAGISQNKICNAHFLLEAIWSDHLINDISFLRADTFSWQSGDVYTSAYNHLVQDIQGITAETETIGSYTVTFYRATDGHKVALADQETTIANVYSEIGIAWYYILDTTNTQFKLPRTKYGFEGLRTNVGDKIDESLPNITGSLGYLTSDGAPSGSGNGALRWNTGTISTKAQMTSGTAAYDPRFNASLSSSTYQDNAPVQERATQMYLYFYVGDYTQTAIEQTAGLNSELFNGKADIDLSNVPNSKGILTESYVNGTSWYRVYSDGWCEQGGLVVQGSGTSGSITFLKPFKNTDYTVVSNCGNNSTNIHVFIVNTYDGKTTSGVSWFKSASGLSGDWRACGYIN